MAATNLLSALYMVRTVLYSTYNATEIYFYLWYNSRVALVGICLMYLLRLFQLLSHFLIFPVYVLFQCFASLVFNLSGLKLLKHMVWFLYFFCVAYDGLHLFTAVVIQYVVYVLNVMFSPATCATSFSLSVCFYLILYV